MTIEECLNVPYVRPKFTDPWLNGRVNDPGEYEFVEHELDYSEGKVNRRSEPVPRISALIYRNKNTGNKIRIDLYKERV